MAAGGTARLRLSELNDLMVSLGYGELPASLLKRAQVTATQSTDVLEGKTLHKLIHSPELAEYLDYTFNKHNDTYNTRVLLKALALGDRVTLADLSALRLSFSAYESECSGIAKTRQAVLDALRAAGKVASRSLVDRWLSGLRESVPERIQLYEFLDVLPLCAVREPLLLGEAEGGEEEDAAQKAGRRLGSGGLFALTSPDFLLSPETKVLNRLDEQDKEEMERRQREEEREAAARKAAAQEQARLAAAAQSNAAALKKKTSIAEKQARYQQLKEDMKDGNSRIVAAKGGSCGTTLAPPPPGSSGPGAQQILQGTAAASLTGRRGGTAAGSGSLDEKVVSARQNLTPQQQAAMGEVAKEEEAFKFPTAPWGAASSEQSRPVV